MTVREWVDKARRGDPSAYDGPDLDAVENLLDAATDLLANVPLPLEPTAEDLRRIIRLDVATR